MKMFLKDVKYSTHKIIAGVLYCKMHILASREGISGQP